MNRWIKYGIVVAGLGALAVIGLGCGSDNKGSNSNKFTAEDQYNEISGFFSFDPDSNSPDTLNVTHFVLSLMTPQYWDGVDPQDIGAQAKRMLPGPMLAGVDRDSLFYDYDSVGGWWVIYYQVSASGQNDFTALTLRDSIRFETQQGAPQQDPTLITARVKLYQRLDLQRSAGSQGLAAVAANDTSLGVTVGSRLQVSRASLEAVQVDGGANVAMNLIAHSGDADSAKIDVGFVAAYNAVTIPIPDQASDACPASGEVTAGMDIAIAYKSGNQSGSADGSWDASVNFTGNGNATVNVESGDFTKQLSGQACNPNP
jgi:hypothetical protein